MTDATVPIQEAKQQLHEIIRNDVPFDQKARDILELGTRCFDADHGYLAQIDQETDHWETTITTETGDRQTSLKVDRDLRETYCRETINDHAPLTLHDAADQGWADDPAFEISDFGAYLGVPLILDDGFYGTVCFVDEDSRSEPFSDSETWFAEHLARLLERELERDHVEVQLTNQTNLATVLNRVLRHNLRNDISVIRGYTERMADQLDDEDTAATVLNHIDNLIDLSQKARELEQIITATSERRQTEIGALVERISESLAQENPAATISVECDDEINAGVLQNFDRALEELIKNAIKHSGDCPTVTIDIESVPNAVEVRIQDDGPGLPEQEAKVLSEGEESPLAHGSGLGLWLAHWIIASHDGSIDPVVTENGTTMVISIPKTPAASTQQQLTELTRSRDRYKATFDHANDAILILDDDGRIMDANPATEAVIGPDTQSLLGRRITEFFPDEGKFETDWQELLQASSGTDTVTIRGSDGVERVLEYSVSADVVPEQHLVISRDITERKKREQDLEFTQDLLAKTERIADVGGWEIDTETNEVYWTDHLFEMLGVGDSEEPSLDEALDVYIEKDRPRVEQAVEQSLSAGEEFDVEARIRCPDEEIRWLTIRGEPTTEDGEVVALRGAANDITDWRRRERLLREMHDIISNRQQSFEEKVQALLELARAELDTTYGTLSEIRGEEYVFKFVDADDESIQSGDVVPVSATNCEIVASTEQTLVLGDVERDAPAETDRAGFTEWGISCYIGAPVFVENEVYGTFCFYDTEPQADQFSDWEKTLVDLMSDWASYELQRQERKERHRS